MHRRRKKIILFINAIIAIYLGVTIARAQSGEAPDSVGAPLIALAHAALRAEVTGTKFVPPPAAAREPQPARAVFVTVEKNGRVLGCRGDLSPRYRTLDEEIIQNARAAAGHDPRYRPLAPADLEGALVTVTVVEGMEAITPAQIETLSPADGLVLTAQGRTGVVLPYEGRDARTRLRWAYRKAGLADRSPCRLQRMRANRYRG